MQLDIFIKNKKVVLVFKQQYQSLFHRFMAIWKNQPINEFRMTRKQALELRKNLLRAADRLKNIEIVDSKKN